MPDDLCMPIDLTDTLFKTIEARRDELVAGLQERVEHVDLRGMARGERERGGAPLERRDALLEHGRRRVGDARVDVAERL